MNANEIHAGKDYIIKIAHNNIKVKVLSHSGHSWIVKTAGGKIMPIQMADRFVRQVAPVGDVPATPAEANETEGSALPAVAVTAATEATIPSEPTVPPSAVPAELAPVLPSVSAIPVSATAEKKLSMLDAAAQVLKEAGHPMKINDILDAMQTSGIWTPGLGKTPDRTLISGFGTEIRRRVKNRFRKTAPGSFEYVGDANHD